MERMKMKTGVALALFVIRDVVSSIAYDFDFLMYRPKEFSTEALIS